MRVPSTISRNFRWRDKENRSAKVQLMFSNPHGCQEKNPTQKVIDLTCRPNLLPTVLYIQADTSLGIFLNKIKVKAMKD